jgi:hypothetical protein
MGIQAATIKKNATAIPGNLFFLSMIFSFIFGKFQTGWL